jgi:hypothetical protein
MLTYVAGQTPRETQRLLTVVAGIGFRFLHFGHSERTITDAELPRAEWAVVRNMLFDLLKERCGRAYRALHLASSVGSLDCSHVQDAVGTVLDVLEYVSFSKGGWLKRRFA